MKVLYIPDVEIGGAANSFKEMVLSLSQNFQITPIIITKEANNLYNWSVDCGFETYCIKYFEFYFTKKIGLKSKLKMIYYLRNMLYDFIAIKKVKKKVNLKEVDIIHTNINRVDLGALLSSKFDIPHVWHIREFGELDYNCISIRDNYIDFMNNNASVFIAISKCVGCYWQGKGLDRNKVKVIYNGVDTSKFENINKNRFDDKSIKMLFSGNISEQKGQIQVIKAISMLSENDKMKVSLDIYGHGEKGYIQYLKHLIADYHLDSIIKFKDYDPKIYEKMNQYDIGFMCSKSEGFGRVTIEYMMSKICVIASNCGANIELIRDKDTGLLYEYNDVEMLSRLISFLINEEDERKRIQDNGYNEAIQKYSSLKNSLNVYELYESLLK